MYYFSIKEKESDEFIVYGSVARYGPQSSLPAQMVKYSQMKKEVFTIFERNLPTSHQL